MTEAERLEQATDLCQSCGFCCDGVLFGWVAVQPDEAPRFHLSVIGETAQLPQPCVHFAGSRCSIYAERPSDCVTYRCKLLRRLDDGLVTFADARASIERTKVLRAELERDLPSGDGDLRARVSAASMAAESAGVSAPEWQFAAAALRGALGRDFSDRFLARPKESA